MKLLQTLFFSVFFIGIITAQDSTDLEVKVDSFLFEIDSLIHRQDLTKYAQLLYDSSGKYEIEDLFKREIQKDYLPHVREKHGVKFFPSDNIPWCRLLIKNNSPHNLTQTLNFSGDADSVLIYVKGANQKIEFFKVGGVVRTEEVINGSNILRDVYDRQMPILLSFEKGEQKEIFFMTSEVWS